MGFLIKSTFWLGIVYSAMPLGEISALNPAPEVGAFVCGPTGAALAARLAPKEVSLGLGAAGCAALAAARLDSAALPAPPSPAPTAASGYGSTQSLTDADRQPPWMGRERRTPSEGSTQSWRATHRSGYKRVANTHPERQTVDD